MTVPAQTPINRHLGNGVTTVFPFTFKVLQASDLEVSISGAIQSTGFTVSGVGSDAGDVTFSVPPAAGSVVVLRRSMTIQRTTDYQNQGAMPAETVDDDHDNAVMLVQQVAAIQSSAIQYPAVEGVNGVLPDTTTRAGKLLGFDALGLPEMVVPTTPTLSGSAVFDATSAVPYVILAAGQSNMDGFEFASTGPKTTDPYVYLWDTDASNNNAVVFGTRFNVGTYGVAPLNQTDGGTGSHVQSLAFECAKNVRRMTGRPVYVVQVAAGNTEIEQWISDATCAANGWTKSGTKSNLSALMIPTGLKAALAAVPGAPTTFDAFIWHQGENNAADGPELYAWKFQAMVNELVGNGVIDTSRTVIAVGELVREAINTNLTAHFYALRRIENLFPTARVVESKGAATFSSTNRHWTGPGILDMGRRYAEALLSPRNVIDWTEKDPLIGAEYGLEAYTVSTDPNPTTRTPISVSTAIQYVATGGPLGKSFRSPENNAVILYTRKLYRVPIDRLIRITYEIQVDDAAGSVDHRAVIAQYDKNRAYISNITSTPVSSPASGVSGQILVKRTFQRNGFSLGADTTLAAGCEFIALGVNLGVGGDDEAFWFNIVELSA